jgi:hypothetical protein
VRADEILTAFVELESAIRARGERFIEEIAGADSGMSGDALHRKLLTLI